MFRIFKKGKNEKKKRKRKTRRKQKNEKTIRKNHTKKKKPSSRRVNGPAQHRAHAGVAGIGSANGRSIGFASALGFP
jgi:hypothetical protein